MNGNVLLTIVGNAEDESYAAQCRDSQGFPPNIQVNFAGEIPNNELGKIITQHTYFCAANPG